MDNLTTQEIKDLLIVLQAFEHELNNADKLLESEEKRTIQALGAEVITHIQTAAPWRCAWYNEYGLPGRVSGKSIFLVVSWP